MKSALAALAALLLTGCAGLSGPAAPSAPFDALGRLLVSGEGRAFSASFRWRHEMPVNEISLMSPAGTTLAQLRMDDSGATLTAADQQEYRAFSAEGLTRRALGWPLPLAQLQYWMRGAAVPDAAAAAVERDPQGRLSRLEQDGWQVRYVYPETGAALPQRLDLEHRGQRIRMVIDAWREPDTQ
ncbi:MAG: lipoprotein insertase outer membrane protein LolB [Burkholderiales bacterium]|jgi:outer membrane lipoprotein LolB|nr:lipoprotein insertase outer membrane protein LolB [Burkholderiales bacterium]